MDIILNKALKNVMSQDVTSVNPLCIGSEIAEIFETNNFHHLPVLDENGVPVGIISASDYHQLQHHFTRLGISKSRKENEKIFRSVLAKEIMTENPFCLDENESISTAVDVFSQNKIHAIIVIRNDKLAGIITPLDILKSIVGPALMDK